MHLDRATKQIHHKHMLLTIGSLTAADLAQLGLQDGVRMLNGDFVPCVAMGRPMLGRHPCHAEGAW